MSERKVINKYYPPDFDPSKIVKKRKKVKTGSASLPTVRLMTPFSMKCDNCLEYISKSRKFNARKESTTQTYLGMKIVRFHIKCPSCASEILFRTDPKSADYVIEFGAKKNYDSGNTNQIMKDETLEETLSRLEKEEEDAKRKEAEKDDKKTTLEELEAKMNNLKRQQEISDELDEIHEKNKKLNESITNSDIQAQIEERKKQQALELSRLQDEEDERLAKAAFNSSTVKRHGEVQQETPNTSHDIPDSDDSEYEQPFFKSKVEVKGVRIGSQNRQKKLGIAVNKKRI